MFDNTLADFYDSQGQTVDAQRHWYSAMSCLAQAGKFYEALSLCHRMLDDPALQQKLRDDLQKYREEIESLRENWYRSMSHDGVV